MLKEAILRTGCLQTVREIANGARMNAEALTQRLIRVLYTYGTNTGIRAVAAVGHGHSEDNLRYARLRFLGADLCSTITLSVLTCWVTSERAANANRNNWG